MTGLTLHAPYLNRFKNSRYKVPLILLVETINLDRWRICTQELNLYSLMMRRKRMELFTLERIRFTNIQ